MDLLIILIGCLFFNGFLSAFEIGYVTVSKAKLRNLAKAGHRSADHVLKLRGRLERTLSVIQVGITLAAIGVGVIGSSVAEQWVTPWFINLSLEAHMAQTLSVFLTVSLLTYLSVVLGELVPKAIAFQKPALISLAGIRFVILLEIVFRPFVWWLDVSTKLLVKVFNRLGTNRQEPKIPVAEKIADSLEELPVTYRNYVINLINVQKKSLRQIMLPWQNVLWIDFDKSTEQVRKIIVTCGHTRMPVMKEGQPIGLLHSKEFFAMLEGSKKDWHEIVRPMLTFAEESDLVRTLTRLQSEHNHMALVQSKSKEIIGVITIEDILEEVVGEIYDEDDEGSLLKLIARTRL